MKVKKILAVLVLLLVTTFGLFATEIGSVNHLKPLNNDKEYELYLKNVFDGHDVNACIALLDQFEFSLEEKDYEPWLKDASLARATLIMGKYITEVYPKDKGRASEFMYRAEELIKKCESEGAPYSVYTLLEALCNSFWYLVDGSIGKGMKFTSMVDDLYDEHPEDFHVLLMKADRYMYSPGIAGGSKKKGRELFTIAENIMDKDPDSVAIWDRFTIYSGLATGYTTKKKTENIALSYAKKAFEIYTNDANVLKVIKDIEG